MRPRSRIALTCAALTLGACSSSDAADPTAPQSDRAGVATVERVIDGDSLELDIDGAIVEARLVGINAPELSDCQGPAARDALSSVAADQPMIVTEFGTDRFGRLLVDLEVGDESINQALVRAGWALALHGDEADWTADMERAAESGLGMWKASEACPAADDRLHIAAVQADPPGNDDEVLIDEWVEIENRGPDGVDLAGWALRDESTSNRYVFESGTLEAGGRLRLRTGCGDDGPGEVHWCSPNGVWSNRGETVLLLAPSGAIEDHRFL